VVLQDILNTQNLKENTIKYFSIDYKADHNGFVSNPHSHRHYEIFYFEKGNASHFIDFEEFEIKDNSFFLVSYNQVHFITAKPNTFNFGYAISIDQAIIHLFDNELIGLFGKFSQSPAFYLEKDGFFTILFKQIHSELQYNKPKSTELIFSFIKIMLTYVWRERKNMPTEKVDMNRHYLEFTEQLENNFTQIKSVQGYAKLLSITTKQLNKVCKEESNQTPLSIIHERINLEAKRKLFYSENQVKDICYDLGFEDTGHFNNFFKKMNKKTPMEFRAEMSQIFN
jgi:AraC family transcriptional regulator, transcriptional activator of pobA